MTQSMTKGLQCIIRRFQTQVFQDGLASYLMLSLLEAKIFQYGFLEEHKMYVNNRYWSSALRNEVAIMAIKPEFLQVRKEMLVEL